MRVVESARERGLLVGKGGSYGNVLRIAPPVAITIADCDTALRILDEALGEALQPKAGMVPLWLTQQSLHRLGRQPIRAGKT